MNIKIFLLALLFIGSLEGLPAHAKTKNDKLLTIVGTAPLSSLLTTVKHSAPANIISLNHAIISSEITGRALKIYIESGSYVKKGKKLVELDCKSYILAKKQANASLRVTITQLNHAKKQFIRNQRLHKQGIIPRELYDKAEAAQLSALANIELQKASIESTELMIQRCQITAPFSGQVTQRIVQKGQLVTPSTPLLQLMQNKHIEVKTMLSPENVTRLKESSNIKFVSGKKIFKAAIRSVIQNINEKTRTQEVRLALPNNTHVAAGLSGRIEWNGTNKQLPAEYIVRRQKKLGVMLVKKNTKGANKAQFVSLANAKEGQATVISLPMNTKIITKNRYRVKSGDSVKIQQEKSK